MNALSENARDTVSIIASYGAIADRRSRKAPGCVSTAGAWLLVAVAAGLLATSAHAGDSRGGTDLAFDCTAMHLPSQQDVTRLLGTHNFQQAYRARERLLQDVRRECLRGVRHVVVKADDRLGPTAIAELVESQ
jgi:hypothetical protein